MSPGLMNMDVVPSPVILRNPRRVRPFDFKTPIIRNHTRSPDFYETTLSRWKGNRIYPICPHWRGDGGVVVGRYPTTTPPIPRIMGLLLVEQGSCNRPDLDGVVLHQSDFGHFRGTIVTDGYTDYADTWAGIQPQPANPE